MAICNSTQTITPVSPTTLSAKAAHAIVSKLNNMSGVGRLCEDIEDHVLTVYDHIIDGTQHTLLARADVVEALECIQLAREAFQRAETPTDSLDGLTKALEADDAPALITALVVALGDMWLRLDLLPPTPFKGNLPKPVPTPVKVDAHKVPVITVDLSPLRQAARAFYAALTPKTRQHTSKKLEAVREAYSVSR